MSCKRNDTLWNLGDVRMANKHTISDLYQMQALPLSAKIRMTENRIRAWVEEYGVDGVYVSFSGGKDREEWN